ncbi:MAG: hypothetical protein WA693_17840, partial [Pseudolabrys sp.]
MHCIARSHLHLPSSSAGAKSSSQFADKKERRANIDSAIASFRPTVETLLSTVSESATAMRATALTLFGSSEQ